MKPCNHCDGTGRDQDNIDGDVRGDRYVDSTPDCPVCNGFGTEKRPSPSDDGRDPAQGTVTV